MKIFIAGASGVIGARLVSLLRDAGHEVVGMTRSPAKVDLLRNLGAEPVVCDVYDASALNAAMISADPEVVIHQITDLPDDQLSISEFGRANATIRRTGTRNLLDAARAAGAVRFIAQSVAWTIPGDGGVAVDDLERMVLDDGGVVVRYGRFYGPKTYHQNELPPAPRIHIDEAARRTLEALDTEASILTVDEGI